jgi:uncharacterized membrane protein
VVVIVALIAWMKPVPGAQSSASQTPVSYAQVQKVIEQRCYMCHGAQVQMKNVRLDSPEGLKQHAPTVYHLAVVAKTMPMNNATGITPEERALIGRWYREGAPTQ